MVDGVTPELEEMLYNMEVDSGLADVLREMEEFQGGSKGAEQHCKEIAIRCITAGFNDKDGTNELPAWQLFVVMTLLVRSMTKRIVSADKTDPEWRRNVVIGMLAKSAAVELRKDDRRGA